MELKSQYRRRLRLWIMLAVLLAPLFSVLLSILVPFGSKPNVYTFATVTNDPYGNGSQVVELGYRWRLNHIGWPWDAAMIPSNRQLAIVDDNGWPEVNLTVEQRRVAQTAVLRQARDFENAAPMWRFFPNAILADWLITAGPLVLMAWLLCRRRFRRLLTLLGDKCCVGCGYNLTGNVSGNCPECGAHIIPG
jgi:hypothetical protein